MVRGWACRARPASWSSWHDHAQQPAVSLVTRNGASGQRALMVRCMTGCIAGVVVGMFGLQGIYSVVNPAWLELHRIGVGFNRTIVVCTAIAGGWLAGRSRDACRYLSAFALASTPLLLLVLLVAEMMSVWGTHAVPYWAWGVPLLTLLSGVVGIRASRRVPHHQRRCHERDVRR